MSNVNDYVAFCDHSVRFWIMSIDSSFLPMLPSSFLFCSHIASLILIFDHGNGSSPYEFRCGYLIDLGNAFIWWCIDSDGHSIHLYYSLTSSLFSTNSFCLFVCFIPPFRTFVLSVSDCPRFNSDIGCFGLLANLACPFFIKNCNASGVSLPWALILSLRNFVRFGSVPLSVDSLCLDFVGFLFWSILFLLGSSFGLFSFCWVLLSVDSLSVGFFFQSLVFLVVILAVVL